MTSPAHQCPATGCTARVAKQMLMCRPHWYMVPRPLRAAVYEIYRNGLGAGSPAHREAVIEAIEAVNDKLTGASA